MLTLPRQVSKPDQHVDGGRLPRAVGSQQAEYLPRST